MQVAATYDNGIIRFTQPIQLKHRQFKLMIDLPDDEVLTTTAPAYKLSAAEVAQAQATLDKFQSIMSAPLPPDEALPLVSTDYQDRLDAMELRAQLRAEQGRPV
jgi:hypothetical protein